MKAVVDTNVFISAFFNPGGSPRAVIENWKKGEITLCLSQEILEEYIEVLERFDFIEEVELKTLLHLFAKRINTVFISSCPDISVVDADPDDNKFIACAVAAEAQYIISGDKHLRTLKKYERITIISPAEFVKLRISQR